MKIRLSIVFSGLILLLMPLGDCQTPDQARTLFYRGNAYYKDGDFQGAITHYQEALAAGYESGALYYNLGNAYFKNGSLGKAILNYSRAKRLMPRDADLTSNLTFARSLIKGEVTAGQRKFFSRMFFALAGLFSLNTITLYCCLMYLLLSAVTIFLILAPRLRKVLSCSTAVLLALLLVLLFMFYTQYNTIVARKEAIIIAEACDSKFEPFSGATTFFTLYEGQKVTMMAWEQEWVKIKRPDGKQGWIKAADIEPI